MDCEDSGMRCRAGVNAQAATYLINSRELKRALGTNCESTRISPEKSRATLGGVASCR